MSHPFDALSFDEMSQISDALVEAEKNDTLQKETLATEFSVLFGFDKEDPLFKDNLANVLEIIKSPSLLTLLDLLDKLGRAETLAAADSSDTFRSVIIGRSAAYFDLKDKLLRLKRKYEER